MLCLHTVHALFMGLITTLLKKYIKNGTHSIIHTFKNYFVTVFSVFSFNKNKLYPNRPVQKKPKKKFITLHPIFNLSLFLMLCFFIFFLTFSLSIIVFKKYWVIWYGCLNNIFQFLNNIIRIFIYFFIHTYF